ncbi:MAG: hypothetical protein JNM07_12580 [Phycisphaerae bacterium]|nr:hypothetical protein [Phycisphaerae bacterium]
MHASRTLSVVLSLLGALSLAGVSSAQTSMDLGGGWRATIFDPDHVSLTVVSVDVANNLLTLRKEATFLEIDPFTGRPQPINISFTQTAPDGATITRFAIDEELLTNQTGVAWDQFDQVLVDSNQAVFNQSLSAGFGITPFTSRSYNGASTAVSFTGGIIPDGGNWNPGSAGAGGGELVWDVNLSSPNPVTFSLKEIPVPAPGGVALMGLAAAVAAGRRRR